MDFNELISWGIENNIEIDIVPSTSEIKTGLFPVRRNCIYFINNKNKKKYCVVHENWEMLMWAIKLQEIEKVIK